LQDFLKLILARLQNCHYRRSMQSPSARQRLADELLGRPVAQFIAEHRAAGSTWTEVAFALREATSGEISVSGEALRQWAARGPAVARSA
jgi:hypothetical protein